jgi:hypothetical protein
LYLFFTATRTVHAAAAAAATAATTTTTTTTTTTCGKVLQKVIVAQMAEKLTTFYGT